MDGAFYTSESGLKVKDSMVGQASLVWLSKKTQEKNSREFFYCDYFGQLNW
jgi:hypothetical protein